MLKNKQKTKNKQKNQNHYIGLHHSIHYSLSPPSPPPTVSLFLKTPIILAFTMKQIKTHHGRKEKSTNQYIYHCYTLQFTKKNEKKAIHHTLKAVFYIKQSTIFGRCLSHRDAPQYQQYITKQEYELARIGKLLQLKVEHLITAAHEPQILRNRWFKKILLVTKLTYTRRKQICYDILSNSIHGSCCKSYNKCH